MALSAIHGSQRGSQDVGALFRILPSGFLSPSSLLKWKSKNAGRQPGTGAAGKPAARATKQGKFKDPAWEGGTDFLATSLSSLVDLPVVVPHSGKEWSGKPGPGNNQSHQRGRALFPHIREERAVLGGNRSAAFAQGGLAAITGAPFVQIHRSHVVNLAHVSRIEQSARSYRVFMGERANALPMSRHRVPDVLPLLQEFLSKPG